MYSLYLLTSTILIINYLESQDEKNELSLTNAYIGYFNYYLFIIPLMGYLSLNFKKILKWTLFRKISLTILTISVLIKTPYVFFWRGIVRTKGEAALNPKNLITEIIWGIEVYELIGWMILIVSLGIWIKSLKKSIKDAFVATQIAAIILMIIIFVFLLQSHEIEWRYFHFFYPIAAWLLSQLFLAIQSVAFQRKLAIGLIAISSYNGIQMFQRDQGKSLEVKKSALELKKLLSDQKRLAVDNAYFFKNYWLIYSELLGAQKPFYVEIDKNYVKTSKRFDAFVSNFSSTEKHNELCSLVIGDCRTLWNEKNILGEQTIISIPAGR